jgi:hypothetical protein
MATTIAAEEMAEAKQASLTAIAVKAREIATPRYDCQVLQNVCGRKDLGSTMTWAAMLAQRCRDEEAEVAFRVKRRGCAVGEGGRGGLGLCRGAARELVCRGERGEEGGKEKRLKAIQIHIQKLRGEKSLELFTVRGADSTASPPDIHQLLEMTTYCCRLVATAKRCSISLRNREQPAVPDSIA